VQRSTPSQEEASNKSLLVLKRSVVTPSDGGLSKGLPSETVGELIGYSVSRYTNRRSKYFIPPPSYGRDEALCLIDSPFTQNSQNSCQRGKVKSYLETSVDNSGRSKFSFKGALVASKHYYTAKGMAHTGHLFDTSAIIGQDQLIAFVSKWIVGCSC
jgi:hypothetical protein